VSAPPAPIRLTAPLTCPACGREVAGCWTEGRETDVQQCGACEHAFEATWPGFTFEPETTIVVRGGDDGESGHDDAG
jgi:hypothetical protein